MSPSCSDDASSTKDAGAQGGSHSTPRAADCPEQLSGAAAWDYDGPEEGCEDLAAALTVVGASTFDAGAADGGAEPCPEMRIETKKEADGACSASLLITCDGRTLSVVCDDVKEDGSAQCAASVRARGLPGGECLLSLKLGASE